MTFIKKAVVLSLMFLAFTLPQKIFAWPGLGIFPPRLVLVQRHPVEEFPPIPENLREGCEYNRQKVLDSLPVYANSWYIVPKWLAGEFAYGEMTLDFEKDFVTGKKSHPGKIFPAAHAGRHRGMLVDKKGNIWEKSEGGAIGSSNPGDKDYHRFDDDICGLILSPTEYIEVSDSLEFIVDDASKIKKVMRMQRIRYFLLRKADNLISVYLEEVHFDEQGHALVGEKVKGTVKKIHDFEPMSAANEHSKGEYSEAVKQLRSFMEKHNKAIDI
jgi:hypothetical protein